MSSDTDRYIREGIRIASELNALAEEVQAECDDDGCMVLCGVMRDCAYKIRRHAENEIGSHRARRFWRGCSRTEEARTHPTQ